MAVSSHRPSRGPDVYLSTVELIETVLVEAEVPVSRNYILERLAEEGHATTRQRLNRALGYFFRQGSAIEGSKGIEWTRSESASLKRAVALGRRL